MTMSTAASAHDVIRTFNPASGEVLSDYPAHSASDVDWRLSAASAAFIRWRGAPLATRLKLLRDLSEYFRAEKRRLATLITTEMGKTIAEAEAEVEKCAWACNYYSDNAPRQLAAENVPTNASRSYVAYRPLGVVLAVMPWNFPFFQVVRFAVPALAAGNVVVLKHAANVTGCSLALEQSFTACDFPQAVFTSLLLRGANVQQVVSDPRIAAVSLTGSEEAGSSVAALAGKHLKKSVLELGGSDSYIVLDDADVEAAARTAVRARFQNCGQSCIAAKRFIVERHAYGDFCSAFIAATKSLRVGDPLKADTDMGPLARADLVNDIDRQIAGSRSMGADVVVGGARIERPGYFYEPTILTGVHPDMPAFREETFGPAAAIICARDEEQAVGLANCSPFGLGNSVWTSDIERAERMAAQLDSGLVFINGMTASDPRLPFGGVKRSGYGRELAHFGIREFTNAQTVWIA